MPGFRLALKVAPRGPRGQDLCLRLGCESGTVHMGRSEKGRTSCSARTALLDQVNETGELVTARMLYKQVVTPSPRTA
jgi:hypothetical protein